MSIKPAGQRIIVPIMLVLLLAPRTAYAQDAVSLFTTLGKFVGGFDAGVVFVAPTGFIHSDVLKERGDLQQVGIALRNPTVGVTVGFDILTGFQAMEESLELRGAITALPTLSGFYDTQLPKIGSFTPSTTFGFGIGLSQLQDARATLPQATGLDKSVKLGGSGYHAGVTMAFGASRRSAGIYVESAIRYTRFPSLDWTDEKSIVPPAGWPNSMDLWTGTLRFGVGIGAP